MASKDLYAISADWLKGLEVASSTGDAMSFVSHFHSDGWFRDLLCMSWNFRTLSGREKIREFLSEVVDGESRLEHSGLRNFKLDDHTVNSPSPFKFPGPQGIEGAQGAFTFSVTNPAALGRGFFRLTQDVDGTWRALTLFTNMQDLVGYEESSADQHGLYEGRKMTSEEYVDAKFRAIEADPTVLIVRPYLCSATGPVGDPCARDRENCSRRRLLATTVLEPYAAHTRISKLHPYPTNFPKYIPKGKLADFLESYAVNQELCIWLSSIVASTPMYDSSSTRWTVEIQRGDQTVILNPKHLVLATGSGTPRIPTWNGMNEFQGTLYHSDFHQDAEQFRGKRVVVVGACNASGDICQDFVAHGAAEVTMIQRSATCVVSSTTAEKTHFMVPFPESSPIEELDFRINSMPRDFLLQLNKLGGTQYVKMFDRELHEGLRKAGFNLTWELSPGSGEVGLDGFVLNRLGAGIMIDVGFGKLIVEGKIKVKQGQDINHFDKDGVVFNDGSRLSANVIVLATGNEPVSKAARALLGDKIVEQLSSKVWGLDSEGELNQTYRPSGYPGLWFAIGPFVITRFFSKHLGLQILARELGIV